jgi:hypothetical protein
MFGAVNRQTIGTRQGFGAVIGTGTGSVIGTGTGSVIGTGTG